MKRLFLFVATALFAANVMSEGHLKFKDVEINGTYNEFIIALTKHGCQTVQNAEGNAISRGSFAGIEMYIIPQITSQTKKVCGVVASSDAQKEWSPVNAQYTELKSMLSRKYGTGQYLQNLKDGCYISADNKIERGNAQNAVLFETDNGKIVLYIHRFAFPENGSWALVVWYIDNANYIIKNQEANLDI